LVWNESGVGREGTIYAMDEMTDIKHLVINYAGPARGLGIEFKNAART
jgi:hypothetical protein